MSEEISEFYKKEKLVGTVERIIYKNESNQYHALKVEVDSVGPISVTITQAGIYEDIQYEFLGEWKTHAKFGRQFYAKSAIEIPPTTKEGLRTYLQSSFFPGIGPVIAGRVVEHFGDNALEIFREEPEKLLTVPGISAKKLKILKETWEKNIQINGIMVFLQQFGINTLYATKIYENYGQSAVFQIKSNPYQLIYDIEGIGFMSADRIALQVGFDENSTERITAAIIYVLDKGNLDSHCYLYYEQLRSKLNALLKHDVTSRLQACLGELIFKGLVKKINYNNGEDRYYSKKTYQDELYCAEKIVQLLDNAKKKFYNPDFFKQKEGDIVLSPEQEDAVRNIINQGVSILTGGPGTGKTSVTKKIVDMLGFTSTSIVLAAPTGRASQRMSEVIGREASTIHKLLGWDPIHKGFLYSERNPLSGDFFIIDESSMIDIHLASSLLRAIPTGAQVLFIGDSDQLPPVGAGSFFIDLIISQKVTVYKLTQIFRQGKESLIIKYAHEINNSIEPVIESPITKPSIFKEVDCAFIDSGIGEPGKSKSQYPSWSSLRYGLDLIDMIIKIYSDTIPKIDKSYEIQVLAPMNIGELGNGAINKAIQDKLNPYHIDKPQLEIRDITLRPGDRVLQKANNYDLGVFNGDIGYVETIDLSNSSCVIRYGSNKLVNYQKSDLLDLGLGYSISIHKAQGSEFDCVILPIMLNYNRMLAKNLVYTGLTRAKKMAVFVGQRKALSTAIKNNKQINRQTSLKEMLEGAHLLTSPI